MANPESWSDYYQATLDKPLHYIFDHLDPLLQPGMTALDLGCGVGRATIHMAAKGLKVLAVDAEAEAIGILFDRLPGGSDVTLLQSTFQELDLAPASFDVVVAAFSLFFLPRSEFEDFWPRMVASLKPGGLFGGQLLGARDEWSARGYTVHERAEVDALISPFEPIYFEEAERDGVTAVGGTKHWHVFHVVGRKMDVTG